MDEYDQVIQALPSWLARPLLELLHTKDELIDGAWGVRRCLRCAVRYMPRRNWDGKERRCKRSA